MAHESGRSGLPVNGRSLPAPRRRRPRYAGALGARLDREGGAGTWFATGFHITLGGVLAYSLAQEVIRISELLVLLLLSLFVAISLDPIVRWLVRHRLRRGWAVALVVAAVATVLAGFVALVVPPVTDEFIAFVRAVPGWLQQLHDHHSTLGHLEDRYHLVDKAKQQLSDGGSGILDGLLGAGRMVISTVTATVVVVVVTLYFMVGLPQIKRFCHRFVPGSRRERVEALAEEIIIRTGRYMLGNLATSGIAGLATFAWCMATDIPYPAALGVLVALMDLVPMVGATIGGLAVSLVALSVSLTLAIATAVFYLLFRLAEDYLIIPRVMRFAVDVHPIVTVVAVLIGGALLGITGALVAIPVAMALGLFLDEFVFPRIEAA
ncbi:AI-2E family transporter [Streptantibioticus rubrisoli]|uniref:AI-2E family transporter n=1 Tax=Streptantibioticus rubrisoli TaxID=1387313 RepID=A0ABT1P6T1_9ACTN|nr:AI-2E family transporter [Streptantibioticus rubrisoli]MCQ4041081.1 AI-2E family transporter [Streptantibioticus rubrisoli]